MELLNTLTTGDFGACNGRGTGFYYTLDKLIILFGGGQDKLTHTLVYLGEQVANQAGTDHLVFEADLVIKRTSISQTSVLHWYHWTDPLVQHAMALALMDIMKAHDGDIYGAAQLPWFIWLWLVEKLKLPARWAKHNIFLSGEICTGIVFLVLQRGVEYLKWFKYPQADQINKIITANGRDYRSQRPVDIEQIGINLTKEGFTQQL